MIKITVTIEEIPEKKSESISGKYLIASSNFGEAYIKDVQCKIISEPYAATRVLFGKKQVEDFIKVMSCITGIEYEIPYKPMWFKIYNTYDEVLTTKEAEMFLHHGHHIFRNPRWCYEMSSLIGKKYYPMDNSYSERIDGERLWVADTTVEIVGPPYIGKNPHGKDEWFVTVKTRKGEIGKCLFMEWKLIP